MHLLSALFGLASAQNFSVIVEPGDRRTTACIHQRPNLKSIRDKTRAGIDSALNKPRRCDSTSAIGETTGIGRRRAGVWRH